MEESASLAQKQDYLARALRRWADRLDPVAGPRAAERLGYRDRVTLTARWSDGNGWRFGLMRRDELIAIHDCPVHTARVRALVHALVQHLPRGGELPLAYLHVAGAQATLVVKSHHVDHKILSRAVEALGGTGLEGLWLHLHPAAGRKLFARSGWRHLWGAPQSRDPHGLLHGPTAFMQAFPRLHRESLLAAREYLGPGPGTSVLDLYCGLGGTLREWTRAGGRSLGVELSGEAVKFAALNAPDATVLRGTCVQRLPQIRAWWSERSEPCVAYVNPPRSGLEAEVTASLAEELRPARIAYLSCSAGTLARDLESFEAAGYSLDRIVPYDFFPLTHHVETLALLERRQQRPGDGGGAAGRNPSLPCRSLLHILSSGKYERSRFIV
jgi:tRNA/tmRNA/rRNA uracil-C5-methylase (TrmA/RlmC/RlmD family)